MLRNIPPDEAADILYNLPVSTVSETVPLWEAYGRVLARDVVSTLALPPFDRSPFDGYAFRGEDTACATATKPVVLKITEEIPAGSSPSGAVAPGYAVKILTGAPIPLGADATIKYELTEFTDSEVKIYTPVPPHSDIVPAGEDLPLGSVTGRQGERISPPIMGLLAGTGLAVAEVCKIPLVAVINTGDELVAPGEPLPPAKIYNSNIYTLNGYLQEIGVRVQNAGVVSDNADAIAQKIEEILPGCDLVITTGGASVGDYDYAVRAAEILGAEVLFWKVSMKPGGSIVASVKDGKLILALSGNPGAAIMGLTRIALPYVKKLCGRSDCLPEMIEVHLKKPYSIDSSRTRLLRGKLEIISGKAYFTEQGGQGGGDISSFATADLLAELSAESPTLAAETLIRALKL
jgi:molybdopterin molybdotransferase